MIPRLIVYLLLAVVALGVSVATLGLPSTAETRAEGAHLGFGYPVSFVWADQTRWNASDYPETYSFDPWETGGDFSGLRFVADWLIWTVLLWASLWFLRRAFTARKLLLSPSDGRSRARRLRTSSPPGSRQR